MEKGKETVVRRFKRKIEAALQLFNDMSPTDRAEAALLWNVISEKLQSIINESSDALKEISVIVVKSSGAVTDDPKGQAPKVFLISGREYSEEDLNNDEGNEADPLTLNDQNERPVLSKAVDEVITDTAGVSEKNEGNYEDVNEPDTERIKTPYKNKEGSPDEIIRSIRGPPDLLVGSRAVKDISEPKVVERNRWSCKSCDKQFDEYVQLQNHIGEEHTAAAKLYKCSQCDKSFGQKSNLKVHERKHSGIRPYACQRCTARFAASSNLRRHLLSHQGVKPYQCSLCTARFAEKRSLQDHYRSHSGEKPFSCPECQLSFERKNVLKVHMATHSDARPFLCSECGKSFKTKTLLRSHENNLHRSENATTANTQGGGKAVKAHACHYCSATFSRKSDLTRHELSHRGERRFVCQEENCGKAFMRKQSLQEHMNRHQGLKPYKCSHCAKAYPQLSEYLKHCKTHTLTSSTTESS